jgi:hypothetical protein
MSRRVISPGVVTDDPPIDDSESVPVTEAFTGVVDPRAIHDKPPYNYPAMGTPEYDALFGGNLSKRPCS